MNKNHLSIHLMHTSFTRHGHLDGWYFQGICYITQMVLDCFIILTFIENFSQLIAVN